MKTATVKKITEMFSKQLEASKWERTNLKLTLKQTEKRINANKKSLAQHSQILEYCAKMKNCSTQVISAVKLIISNIHRNIHSDRKEVVRLTREIQRATVVIKQNNELLNEVSPYTKKTA